MDVLTNCHTTILNFKFQHTPLFEASQHLDENTLNLYSAALTWIREIRILKLLGRRTPVLGKAQAPRVEASQGFYCPGFIQPNKQKKKQKHVEASDMSTLAHTIGKEEK